MQSRGAALISSNTPKNPTYPKDLQNPNTVNAFSVLNKNPENHPNPNDTKNLKI